MDTSSNKKPKNFNPILQLPEDVIWTNILPLLSYKSLCKLKSVSSTWRDIISYDSKFAADQSVRPSPFSCGFVVSHCDKGTITFIPTFDSSIGFNPSNAFFKNTAHYTRSRSVLASSHGLLCILYSTHPICNINYNSLFVGNLSTGEGDSIEVPNLFSNFNIGLAFDPLLQPNHYKLVHPILYHHDVTSLWYEFYVFSNKSCNWVRSRKTIGGIAYSTKIIFGKPICAKNVVYFDFHYHIVSFDPWNDVAKCIEMPRRGDCEYRQEIGVYNNENCITCTSIGARSMEVWMYEDDMWSMKYALSMDELINVHRDAFKDFWHPMVRRSGMTFERLRSCYDVNPFPYEGGDWLFFRVMVDETNEVVMSYNLRNKGLMNFCDLERRSRAIEQIRVFSYHNSMVKMPQARR